MSCNWKDYEKTLSVCVLLFFLTALNAQDIIVLRDATEIEAKVIEVTDSQISYKRFDNPDGPMYRKNTSDVLFVKYANGTKEVSMRVRQPLLICI